MHYSEMNCNVLQYIAIEFSYIDIKIIQFIFELHLNVYVQQFECNANAMQYYE